MNLRKRFYATNVRSSVSSTLILHEPGLLSVKNGLSSEEQQALASFAYEVGERQNGFYTHINNERKLNSKDYRGRIFGAMSDFPTEIKNMCSKKITMLNDLDLSLRMKEPTHFIMLYYKTLEIPPPTGYISWHRDNGENDGDANHPVLSFSIGDACDFLVAYAKPKISAMYPISNPENLIHRIELGSGDMLVFGGARRFIWHGVYNGHQKSALSFFPFDGGRLNFTFRYAPSILGREKDFQTTREENLQANNQFYKLYKL